MDYINCPEKKVIEERIDKIEKITNMKDEESERAITNLTTNMNNFMKNTKQEIEDLKNDIQELRNDLPNIFQKELNNSLDTFMLNLFKKLLKWIIGIIIAGFSFIFRTNIIHFLKDLFK